MSRPDPFDPNDGCGDGYAHVSAEGLVNSVYNLWNRNPIEIKSTYLTSGGKKDRPPAPKLVSF
jgi:hypothetical protein